MTSFISICDMIKALNSCDCEHFPDLWNSFVTLYAHGFIDDLSWRQFRDLAHELFFSSGRFSLPF